MGKSRWGPQAGGRRTITSTANAGSRVLIRKKIVVKDARVHGSTGYMEVDVVAVKNDKNMYKKSAGEDVLERILKKTNFKRLMAGTLSCGCGSDKGNARTSCRTPRRPSRAGVGVEGEGTVMEIEFKSISFDPIQESPSILSHIGAVPYRDGRVGKHRYGIQSAKGARRGRQTSAYRSEYMLQSGMGTSIRPLSYRRMQ